MRYLRLALSFAFKIPIFPVLSPGVISSTSKVYYHDKHSAIKNSPVNDHATNDEGDARPYGPGRTQLRQDELL
jgi:hypothetical protein